MNYREILKYVDQYQITKKKVEIFNHGMKEEVEKRLFVDTFITAELIKICKKYIQETRYRSSKCKRSYVNIFKMFKPFLSRWHQSIEQKIELY